MRKPKHYRTVAFLLSFGMVGMSLLAAGYKSWFDPLEPSITPHTNVVAMRSLRFEDGINGQIVVIDGETGELIEHLEPGSSGFLRTTLRGLARVRKAESKGSEIPFIVERHSDGQELLVDPATNRTIVLRAFGASNSAVFTRYLERQKLTDLSNQEARL